MMQDSVFEERISQHLKSRFLSSTDNYAGFERPIREAIRLLEGLIAAPSSSAMKSQEREFEGLLKGYWYVHAAQSNMARTYNNVKGKGDFKENPTQEEVISQATRKIFELKAKEHNISTKKLSHDKLMERIINAEDLKGVSEQELLVDFNRLIQEEIERLFFSKDEITGDWLIFCKSMEGDRYYLDHHPHIGKRDNSKQQSLKAHLDLIRERMNV